jgi:hypothetical protein
MHLFDWPFGNINPHSYDMIMADPPWRFLVRSETGVYVTLIMSMYERGEPIPEDHARLHGFAGRLIQRSKAPSIRSSRRVKSFSLRLAFGTTTLKKNTSTSRKSRR